MEREKHKLMHSYEALREQAGVPRWVYYDARCWGHFIDSGYAVDMQESLYFDAPSVNEAQFASLVTLLFTIEPRHAVDASIRIAACRIGGPTKHDAERRHAFLRTLERHGVDEPKLAALAKALCVRQA